VNIIINNLFKTAMKNFLVISGITILLLAGAVWWSKSLESSDPNIISTRGIHWHPELTIYVNDVKEDLPANLGIVGSSMAPVHTHEADGVIHLEFQGLVRKNDIILGQFFKSWNKDIRSFGTNVKMTVNGKENTEYENYIMQDKDKIELRYE